MATEQLASRITAAKKEIHPEDIYESEQEMVCIPDRGGKCLCLQVFRGKYYSIFFKPSILKGIRNLDLRNDDIYIPSFARTGTHWTFDMISMLLNGKAETIPSVKTHIESATADELEALPSPRVLTAHINLSDAPEQILEKKCKIVYKLRDPKDVAVSLYHVYKDIPFYHYKGEFKDFLYLFLEGKVNGNSFFDHIRDAEKFFDTHPEIPVHIQAYEDTIKVIKSARYLNSNVKLMITDSLTHGFTALERTSARAFPWCIPFTCAYFKTVK